MNPACYWPVLSERGKRFVTLTNVMMCSRVKEVVCFGEGAGANILARFAVS